MKMPECLPRNELKQYLAGWSDSEQSDLIEAHLADCETCEQTMVDLESNPETLVEFLGHRPSGRKPKADSAIENAIAFSRDLMSSQIGHGQGDEHPHEDPEHDATPTQLGIYDLLRPLGHGGMGSVYLAKHRKLGKEVAIKVLPARRFSNPVFAARFQREIQAAGGLEHPAIVRATDAGDHQGTHYLVMEHIDGLDLSQVAKAVGELSIADACEITRCVASGLAQAHRQGIIHRDVKPSNLMLSREGECKILDFGLARIGPWEGVSAELTTVGQLMGTLDYMAPEQAERADAVDYRADLYSLGATLFRLLCGRAPLAAAPDLSPLAKLRLMATHEPPRLDTMRSDAPAELVELVGKLLSRDPAKRPASADHLAEELQQFCEGHELSELSKRAIELRSKKPQGQLLSPALPDLAITRAVSNSKSGNSYKWLGLALMLPLMIFAGIWITIETQKGLLVIDSDAEATLRLLKDGKEYDEVQVVPGPNSTRIFAGKYEVVLAEGSDALKLSKEQIDVTKGGTSIASLGWSNAAAGDRSATPNSATSSNPPARREPVYRGKPLSEYMDILAYERSPEGLGEAFEALEALTTGENSKLISERLLELLPGLDGSLRAEVMNGNMRSNYSVDSGAFRILAKANREDQFVDLLISEMRHAQPEWAARLMEEGFARVEDDRIAPLLECIESELASEDAKPAWFNAGAQHLIRWYIVSKDEALKSKARAILVGSAQFDRGFWLQQVQFSDATKSTKERDYSVLLLAKPYCLEAIQDPAESDSHLAQAAIMLIDLAQQELLTKEDIQALAKMIPQRASEIKGKDLVEILELPKVFNASNIFPKWKTHISAEPQELSNFMGGGGRSGRRSPTGEALSIKFNHQRDAGANLPSKLLELAELLDVDMEEQCRNWLKITSADYEMVREKLDGLRGDFRFDWPSLAFTSAMMRGSGPQLTDELYATLSNYPKQRMVAYFLHVQAQRFLPEEANEASNGANADSNPQSPVLEQNPVLQDMIRRQAKEQVKATQEVLYKGRKLSEWLRILPLEKSSEGITEALQALQALVSTETAAIISKELRGNLPKMDWDQTTHYEQAFLVMLRADSKAGCNWVIDQLETSQDEDWKRRLITSSLSPKMEFVQVEPIYSWLRSKALVEGAPLMDLCSTHFRKLVANAATHKTMLEPLLDALKQCKPLQEEDGFWYDYYRPDNVRQNSAWITAVSDRAMAAWTDAESSPERVMEACRVLDRAKNMEGGGVFGQKTQWDRYIDGDKLDNVLMARITKTLEADPLAEATSIRAAVVDWFWPSEAYFTLQREFGAVAEENQLCELLAFIRLAGDRCHPSTIDDSPYQELLKQIVESQRESVAKLAFEVAEEKQIDMRGDRFGRVIPSVQSMLKKVNLTWPLADAELKSLELARNDVLSVLVYREALELLGDGREEERKLLGLTFELKLSKVFSQADKNQDKLLDAAELTTLAPELKKEWYIGHHYEPEELGSLSVDSFDKNADKKVSLEEVGAFRQAILDSPAARRKSASSGKVDEAYVDWAKKQMSRYDFNKDGQLSKAEWQKMIIKPVGADLNGDGTITVEEYAVFRASKARN
ncbi:MAG: protein kinase [Planctomycetota bacterium]